MSKDTIKVNMNVYDIPIVVEQLKKLEQENKQLKERLKNEEKVVQEYLKIEEILDKVREYINKNKYENTFRLVGNEETGKMESLNGELLDLLEILGG